jgi:hypothetical protein
MDMPKMPDALCAGEDPEMFFAPQRADNVQNAIAKSVCAPCAHVTECGEYAMFWDVSGVWGGLDERQRAAIRVVHDLPAPKPVIASDFINNADVYRYRDVAV